MTSVPGSVKDGPHVAAALTTFERPVGVVQSYVVACTCGWESQHTSSWRKSLDSHFYRLLREEEKAHA